MFLDTVDQFATIAAGKTPLIINVAAAKMNAPAVELVARAMLCNWLVCLAIWTSARMTNDTAKCIAIFWCLYAFIASGFEHSVANMTLLLIALLAEHPATVTLAGLGWNLLLGDDRQRHQRRGDRGARLLGSIPHTDRGRAIGATGRRRIGSRGGPALLVPASIVL